jgi:ribonuclease P protein component, eubacterial
MLPKNSRISRKEFPGLLTSKRFFHSAHLSLRVAHSTKTQIAVSVSKKISKKASDRNTVRRRTYSALRLLLKNIKPSMLLFVAKKGAESIKGDKLETEIKNLLNSAGLVERN